MADETIDEITLTIDGQAVTVPAGTTILKAAEFLASIFPPSVTTKPVLPTACAACVWLRWKAAVFWLHRVSPRRKLI